MHFLKFFLTLFTVHVFATAGKAIITNTTSAVATSSPLSLSSSTSSISTSAAKLSTIVVSGTTYAPVTAVEYASGTTFISTFNDYDIIVESKTVDGTLTSWTATINIGAYAGFTPYSQTLTQTVPAFLTETLEGPGLSSGQYLTIIGPTTLTTTVLVQSGQANYYYDIKPPTSATKCYPTSWFVETGTARQVTYASQKIFTTAPNAPAETTWTTFTQLLTPAYNVDPHGMSPGQYCGGLCGFCGLYYPSVSVYYWPVASPNTACLTSTAAASASSGLSGRGIQAHARGILGNGSTLVSDGFTFTSPSAYIVFPTISAANGCGLLGSVHTSVTVPIAPGDLSTVVGHSSYSFDFADALCPPASLYNVEHISMVGQGYKPVIAPIAALTNIDHEWVFDCYPAAFQGNDPPYALTPAANLVSPTTKVPAQPEQTSASPSSAIQPIPVQTPAPSPSSHAFAPQPESSRMGGDKSSSVPNNPVHPSSPNPSAVPSSSYLSRFSSPVTATPLVPAGPASKDPSQPSSLAASPADPAGAGSTSRIPISTSVPTVIPIAGQAFTYNSASVLVAGTASLVLGGPAVTISNTPISLASSAGFVVIGTHSQPLLTAPASAPTPATPVSVAAITFAGTRYTVNSASAIIIGSQTLTPGSVVTISGTPVSFTSLASPPPNGAISTATTTPRAGGEVFTLAGKSYTLSSASDVVIDTQTLTPNGVITVSGTPVSLGAGATDVVVGSSTQGLGGYIMSGLGGGPGATATIKPFLGVAGRVSGERVWVWGMLVAVGVVWVGAWNE